MSVYSELKEQLRQLKTQYDSLSCNSSDNLQYRVLLAYSKKISTSLMEAFIQFDENSPEFIACLENVLNENWKLIQGTMLCYTALPNHDLTSIVCDIAQMVADYKNQNKLEDTPPIGVINILMPGLSTQAIMENYPALAPYEEEIEEVHWINRYWSASELNYLLISKDVATGCIIEPKIQKVTGSWQLFLPSTTDPEEIEATTITERWEYTYVSSSQVLTFPENTTSLKMVN